MRRGCGCLVAVPMLVMGLAFTLIGAVFLLNTIERVSDNVEANGVIVDLRPSSSGDSTTYAPVIEFVARDGAVYRFTSNFSRSPAPSVGDTIGVLYDPSDPTDAAENSRGLLWIFPLVFLVVGLLVLAIGIWTFARRVVSGGKVKRSTRRVVVPGSEGVQSGPGGETADDPDGPIEDPGRPQAAQFRRVEPRGPDAEGRFEYRIVAKSADGGVHYSAWLDADPTTELIMGDLDELRLDWRGDRSTVDWSPQDS